MNDDTVDAQISPEDNLNVLSKFEVSRLLDTSQGGLYALFRTVHSRYLVPATIWMMARSCWSVIIFRHSGRSDGARIKLDVKGAPASAFVDGKLDQGNQRASVCSPA